jgi:serine phosphatase RsbU (regulator of sigma subunit)
VINAGCIPPYIKRASGNVEPLEIGGFALGQGLGDKLGYQALALSGGAGDLIILTSDGVVEAMSPTGEMFGFERLGQAIAAGPTGSAVGMLDYLRSTLDAFVGGVEPHDDMTIVIAQL